MQNKRTSYLLLLALLLVGGGCVPKWPNPPSTTQSQSELPVIPTGDDLRGYITDPQKLAQLIEARHTLDIADAKRQAASDFYSGVRQWTGWAMGILIAASIGALIAGFVPGLSFVTKGEGLAGFGVVAAISVVRYVLLAYGVLVGTIAGWTLVGLTIAGGAWLVVFLGNMVWRSHVLKLTGA